MSHDHHHHIHTQQHARRIRFAFWLNTLFILIEVIGGFMTNSMAILSDAAHDLGDSISLGVAWYLQYLSGKNENEVYTFGYRRFSILGALINSVVLLLGSILIIANSIPRLFETTEVESTGMLWLSLVGIIANGIGFYILTGGKSLNERVVSLHLLEDVLGWVAILVGSVIIMLWNFTLIDPLLSIAIAIYILVNVYRNSRSVFNILLQRFPENLNRKEVIDTIHNTTGVVDFRELRIWTLDEESHVLSVILIVPPDLHANEIDAITKALRQQMKKFKINHTTFEITVSK